MGYRTTAKTAQRTLTVRNHGLRASGLPLGVGALLLGSSPYAVGALCADGEPPSWLWLVLVALGIVLLFQAARMLNARTRLVVTGDRLIVHLADGSMHDFALANVQYADVQESQQADSTVYRTRIVMHSGAPLVLDGSQSTTVGHYRAVAEKLNRFLNRR